MSHTKSLWGMGTWWLAGLMWTGCATSTGAGPHSRAHAAPPAPPLHLSAASSAAKGAKKDSPLVHACRTGNSRACNDLGDRLMVKHAYGEAGQWYRIACERARSAMLPTAAQLVRLSHDLAQPAESAARTAALKADAAEITARVRGCFDAAETLRTEHELGQAVTYYEAACEFSALGEVVGDTVPTFAIVVERGCAGTQAARAELRSGAFNPTLFNDLVEQTREEAAKATAAAAPEQAGTDMAFRARSC